MEQYIGDTIDSILNQKYPELEYIVIDGCSTDNTCNIVRSYGERVTKLISEKDDGQYHAIQKGLDLATGDIMGWLNADDIYMPWTLSVVSEVFKKFPDVDWIIGLPSFLNERGQCISVHSSVASFPQKHIRNGWYRDYLAGCLQQESMFWRRSLWEKVSGLDTTLSLAADFKLWVEFARYAELVPVAVPLAAFRKRPDMQRSSVDGDRYASEVENVCGKLQKPSMIWNWLSRRGLVARYVCRIAQWNMTTIIAYCESHEEWTKVKMLRSICRVSIGNLMLSKKLRI